MAKITLTHSLTLITIIGSVVSFLWSWRSDRELRIHENIDKIRVETANMYGKLQRTRAIYLSLYDELQPDIVEVSITAKSVNLMAARDQWYKMVNQRKADIHRRILDEQVETAYVGLIAYDEGIDSIYTATMVRLKSIFDRNFKQTLTETVITIDDFKGSTNDTAILGNALRGLVRSARLQHEFEQSGGSTTLEKHLKDFIHSPDKAIVE